MPQKQSTSDTLTTNSLYISFKIVFSVPLLLPTTSPSSTNRASIKMNIVPQLAHQPCEGGFNSGPLAILLLQFLNITMNQCGKNHPDVISYLAEVDQLLQNGNKREYGSEILQEKMPIPTSFKGENKEPSPIITDLIRELKLAKLKYLDLSLQLKEVQLDMFEMKKKLEPWNRSSEENVKEKSYIDTWRREFWKFTSQKAAETALLEAAKSNDASLARFLIDVGTNINALNEDSLTPLHLASENGHTKVLELLLKEKAFLNAKDKWKWTPLHYCAAYSQPDACAILINAGATIDLMTHDGRTPLHRVAAEGTLKIAQMLLDHGANPNARDKWQWTPLFYSSWYGHLNITTLLIERGALVNARSTDNDFSGTPLKWAHDHGHTSVIKYLQEHGGVM